MRIIPVAPPSFAFQLTSLVSLILFDNIPARSFALLTHRLHSSQLLAFIIARLRLAFSRLLWFAFQLTSLVTLILFDNIPARSFALLTHRLPSSQPLAYFIARLRFVFSKLVHLYIISYVIIFCYVYLFQSLFFYFAYV